MREDWSLEINANLFNQLALHLVDGQCECKVHWELTVLQCECEASLPFC